MQGVNTLCGATLVSEAKAKLVFGWLYRNLCLHVGCDTTPKVRKNLSQIVVESGVETEGEFPVKHLLLIAFLLVGSCLFAVGQKGSAAKELISMENRYNDALVRADWKSLESILADDLIFNNADGSVSHKPDTISGLMLGDIKFDSIAMSDVKVQDFGGVGVVTGKLVEKARYKSSDLSGSYRFLDVWVKRQGRWQNVAGQETRYK